MIEISLRYEGFEAPMSKTCVNRNPDLLCIDMTTVLVTLLGQCYIKMTIVKINRDLSI